MTSKTKRLIFLLVSALGLAAGSAFSQDSLSRISSQMSSSGSDLAGISVVRESALREAAATLGAQAGLHDRSCEIDNALQARVSLMDKEFRFNSLMMGRGMLPPVISEARDTVTIDKRVIRVASRAYHLDEPAMLVDTPPTWRDWLYVGLDADNCSSPYQIPEVSSQLRPRDGQERAFFNQVLTSSYQAGKAQAQSVYEENLARLERTYRGMRRYFELYERGMVSAPVLVSSTDVVAIDDPNTMILGNTVIRIIRDASFIEKVEAWKPLMPQ